ncbi:MAG: RNA polymerase sigma factor, partial [Candidatus Limnocylindrales bacterium]
ATLTEGEPETPVSRRVLPHLMTRPPTTTDDAAERTLAARLAHDLDGGFEAFVLVEQDLVFGIALRSTGDAAAAEDLAQDAFVRAYRALATYDAERIRSLQLRAWLARITMNLCRNRARARRSRPNEIAWDASPMAVAPPADPSPAPESVVLRREADIEWSARLAALPDRYRTAVELRHVHGLSYEECAVALDRPVNTVKTHVHRGVALLRASVLQEAQL